MTIFIYMVESKEQFNQERRLEMNQIRSLLPDRKLKKFKISSERRNEYQTHFWKSLEKYVGNCIVVSSEDLYNLFFDEIKHDIDGKLVVDKKEYVNQVWKKDDLVFIFARKDKDNWHVCPYRVIPLY